MLACHAAGSGDATGLGQAGFCASICCLLFSSLSLFFSGPVTAQRGEIDFREGLSVV